jgi:hypothetical protein
MNFLKATVTEKYGENREKLSQKCVNGEMCLWHYNANQNIPLSGETVSSNHLDKSLEGIPGGKNVGSP